MLPLSAEKTPASSFELAQALKQGLEHLGISPAAVEATGVFPDLAALRLNLTGARLTRTLRKPEVPPGTTAQLRFERVEVVGNPVYLEQAAVILQAEAEGVAARLAGGVADGALVLESARSGSFMLRARREEIEALLHAVAVEAAAKQGFEVKQTSLSFNQEGPRTVSFRAEVTAKVFIMSATLALLGRLTIDDELNARVTDLKLDGDAMILKLAAAQARPHLDRLEGRVLPLMAFSVGGLKLRDVELTAGAELAVRAVLGGV